MKQRCNIISNQVFLGFPWTTTMRKYQICCNKLRTESPLSFIVVGVKDDQHVEDLFNRIKRKLFSSSYAIFDVTGNNANVALEFGMAEVLNIQRALYYKPTKPTKREQRIPRIMADLEGSTRNDYKTTKDLFELLRSMSKNHPFTKKFEKIFVGGKTQYMRNKKARERRIALRIIRRLDDRYYVKKGELITACVNHNYDREDVNKIFNRLVRRNILISGKTNGSRVSIASA